MTTAGAKRETLLDPDVLNKLRERSAIKASALILSAWGMIFASIYVVTTMPVLWLQIALVPFTIAVIGSRQLGLAILMHDGAHGGLAKSGRLNLWLSQWLCAYPIFTETVAYRKYHLKHHAYAQTKQDPDLILSAPFPVTASSLRRKMLRDLTGRTGLKQRTAQFSAALGPNTLPTVARVQHFWKQLGRSVLVNTTLAVALTLAFGWWAYPLFWLLPLLTWQQLVTRIRNIAEHALLDVGGNPLQVARTTYAGFVARLFFAPYWVNYHAEHHIFISVPCYNLRRLHRELRKNGMLDRLIVSSGYLSVLKAAVARS
jgi:fatty acid desaturase